MVKMMSEQENSPRHSPHAENSYHEDTDESSDFVVLDHSSSFYGAESSIANVADLQFSIASTQPDLSPEDIQQWINQLLKENQDLRDSLAKTNVTMKHQFQTLQQWEAQFTANCKQYKLQIEAEQECKIKLEEENRNLRKTVEELQTTINAAAKEKEKLSSVEEKDNELEKQKKLVSELEKKISELERQNADLEKQLQRINERKEPSTAEDKFSSEIRQSIQRPSIIVSMEDYSVINQSEELTVESGGSDKSSSAELTMIEASKLVSSSLQMQEEQTRVSQLSQQLAERQFQVSKLQLALSEKQKENEKLLSQLQECNKPSPLENKEQAVASILRASEEKFQVAAMSAQKYKEKCESLQHYLNIYQQKLESLRLNDTAVIENLQLEITTLRQMLAEEQVAKLEDKKHLEEVRQQFDHMMMEFKKDELKAWKQLEKRRHQEDLDKVTAVLVEKNDLISKLQEEINEMKIQVEKIPILEAQLQVYKQDFQDESKAKNKAEKTIACLKAEVQLLYTEKEKLSEQITSLSRSPSHHRKHSRPSPSRFEAQAQYSQQSQVPDKLVCPKCEFAFTDMQALLNHIETCIKDSPYDYP